MSKEKFSTLKGEKKPRSLGSLGPLRHGIVAVLNYLFRPHELTINDARRLKDIHEKTGLNFPIKSERVNKK